VRLDENVPIAAVLALRIAGHDVYSASESDVGALDTILLAHAHAERRLLITFDRDFGDLAVQQQQSAAAGIMLLRFVARNADEVSLLLTDLLGRTDMVWAGRLSVVDRNHIRQRPL
jgi:predicted nuclease of predicted toxin-antitoxin system